MKKLVSLIMMFLFVFFCVADLFAATQATSVNLETFDNYVVTQAQNTFESSLCQNDTQNKNDTMPCDLCFVQNNLQSFSDLQNTKKGLNISVIVSQTDCNSLNNRFTDTIKPDNNGIGKYKIKQNSYLALIVDNKLPYTIFI